jgi:transcription antitermination factor NusG
MPVLPAEPEVFPPDLFAETAPERAGGRSWWVLHTRPRQEKSLARYLHDQQVPYYLPQVKQRLRYVRCQRTVYLPLFPGYLFLLAEKEECLTALSSRRVARSLAVAAQDELWRDLRQVHRLIDSGAPLTPEARLRPGQAVEVRGGPLAGLRGTVLRTASGRRLLVQVNFIQSGASLEVDDLDLVPINEP